MPSEIQNIDEEVINLLQLASDKQANSRSVLFNTITSFLERRHSELSKTELALMSEILEKLLKDVEMSVRTKLADKLATSSDAPLDLVILLANDQIEVSKPLLLISNLLSDKHLIDIIRHKTVQHQLSIASREKLSSDVCRELITVGNNETIITLLHNRDAKIDNHCLALLVEKSKKTVPIQPPLIEHPDLPREMAASMYQWVSDSLKQSILTNLDLNHQEIEDLLLEVVEESTSDKMDSLTREKSEIILVNKLHKAGKLQPSFLMKCLNQGQSSLFEIAFAKMISVPRKIMRSFLYDRGAEALAVSCCAAGIDQSVFLTIFELTRAAKNENVNRSSKEVTEAFASFKRLDKKRANLTIQKWVAEATGSSMF